MIGLSILIITCLFRKREGTELRILVIVFDPFKGTGVFRFNVALFVSFGNNQYKIWPAPSSILLFRHILS